jgi:hypothetical protein
MSPQGNNMGESEKPNLKDDIEVEDEEVPVQQLVYDFALHLVQK